MGQIHQLDRVFSLSDAGLAAMFEVIDDLHSAASDGQLHKLTTLSKQELVGWLRELAYTAEEAIEEIEKERAQSMKRAPLRLVK